MSNPKKWYAIVPNDSGPVDILIHDYIGWGGITSKDFLTDLANYKGKELRIKINSPGGDVFDGVAIHNAILEHEGKKTIVIDGLAASIASVIAMAGDSVEMYETAELMIHKPWTMTMGNADQLRKDADLLDKIQTSIMNAYRVRANVSDEKLEELINSETWMTADEAKEYGFVDKVIKVSKKEKEKQSAKLVETIANFSSKDIFSQFKSAPMRIAAALMPESETVKTEHITIQTNSEGTIEVEFQPIENNASTQNKGVEMTPEEKTKLEESVRAEAVLAERKRQADIRSAGNLLKLNSEIVEKAINSGKSADEANREFILAHGQMSVAPVQTPSVEVVADETDKFRNATKASFAAITGLIKDPAQRKSALALGAPKDMHGLIREILVRSGEKGVLSMDGEQLYKRIKNSTSQGTGDFTNILADTVNKSLSTGVEEAQVSFTSWTKTVSSKDFRAHTRAKLSSVSELKTIAENAPFTMGSMSDKKETGTVTTKGLALVLSRQAVVNDDLQAFVEVPRKMGIAVMDAQEKDCYDLLYGSGVGPVMTEDSLRLFDATATIGHGNYASSGAAPSATTLDAGIKAMKTAKKLMGNAADAGYTTGIGPSFLIVPPGLEATASILTDSMVYPVATYPSGMPNPYGKTGRNPLTLVVSSYLSLLDANGWYLAADPNRIDTIIRLTLQGNESPYAEYEATSGTDPLGFLYKIYFDWAFMAGDWRGLYLNDGE